MLRGSLCSGIVDISWWESEHMDGRSCAGSSLMDQEREKSVDIRSRAGSVYDGVEELLWPSPSFGRRMGSLRR